MKIKKSKRSRQALAISAAFAAFASAASAQNMPSLNRAFSEIQEQTSTGLKAAFKKETIPTINGSDDDGRGLSFKNKPAPQDSLFHLIFERNVGYRCANADGVHGLNAVDMSDIPEEFFMGKGECADLREANLRERDLHGLEFKGADMRKADLRDAHLEEANLSFANLSGANLSAAHLARANLSGANLSGADIRGANFSAAHSGRANLSGANLSGADIRGSNLSNAILTGAYYTQLTALPFNQEEATQRGMICMDCGNMGNYKDRD